MAAYDALISLSQTTDPSRNQTIQYFAFDAGEKINYIHRCVVFLLSFLEQSPEKAKFWEGRFRDVAYHIENTIEFFMWNLIQSGDEERMNIQGVLFEGQLYIMMREINEIVGQMMKERPVAAVSSSSTTLAPIGSSDTVVGLDENLMEIKDRLCGETPNLQIIPIVGMGGIGKTTLATTIYHDPSIMERFDIRAWLTISQNYSPHRFKKILLDLVDSMKLLQEQMFGDEIDECQIKLKVHQHLKGRRYLIIIDDVWGTEVWDDVMVMFPDDENGSRIMFTTRQLDVASYPGSYSARHDMRCMNDSQCWDLLKLKVFSNSNCPPELEDTGKEIARRCAGLPLAVVLVAGFLPALGNETRASWEEIARNINPVVNGELEEILSLSYTCLPHHLRPCFLLIGGLEDAYIQTSRLTKLWVAEGFVKHQSSCGKTLEEKAEEYLADLVKRNLVIVASRKSDGKIKRCKLHDLVRDLCIRIAHQEKFLHVMDGRDGPQGLMNERRISCIRSDIDEIWCPTIHTILCFQNHNFPSWLASLRNYRVLRVLDVLGIELKELPSQVFELYHLRYIALKGNLEIPSAISKLFNLQTLIIHLAFGKRWSIHNKGVPHLLPLEIWRMLQLRHLVFNAPCMLLHPQRLSRPLENLQTLLLVRNLVWNLNIPQMIPNVKRLGLVYTTNEECHIHHLKDLHQLEKLEVIGCPGFSELGINPSFPMTLRKLTLVGGVYPWSNMGIIGSLPNLGVLKLLDYACSGDTWETADGDFPQLNFLLIDESNIQSWITQSSHFPRLKHLVLRSCWFLTEIPQEIGDIPTLELIEVDTCTKSLLESSRQIKMYQESCGNDSLQVRVSHEVIQSLNLCIGLKDQLKNVREQIGLIAGEMTDVRANLPISISSPSRRESTGNDAVAVAVKDRLCEDSSKLQVIPIVGKGGIGKTTLARTVYNDPSIMRHFQIRFWVTLSQDYTPREIIEHLLHSIKLLEESMSSEVVEEACKNIIAQILGKKIDSSEMAEQVRYMLQGKRYLIVLDNLWSTKLWDDVRNIFPDDGNGSRIMLTTRLSDVATYPDSGSPLHQMMLMNDHQSWNLLKEKVFTNSDCPVELEDVGKEIARRCVGLPLAVVLVAGVLSAVSKTRASWNEVAKNVSSVVGGELEIILSLSYTHLPRQLRPCFLFIGGFPENANIRASRLIKLWEAEGFLEHKNGWRKSSEEEAEEYLEELVKRNLVIASSRTRSGKIKSAGLHDVVRGMCTRKAEEEKFLHVMDRRDNSDNIWDPTTRTILCFHLQKVPICVACSGGFRLLRAWDESHKKLLSQVFELVDLRYLALNASLDIPSAISNLANLQTLIIHPTLCQQKKYWRYDESSSSHFSLPVEIWRLRQLRHLIFYHLCMLPHPPDGPNLPLQNLQTLWHVKNLVLNAKIMRMIPNVKRLGLVYTIIDECDIHHLKDLHQLEKLEVQCCPSFNWRGGNPSFPTTLKKLTLMGGGYPWNKGIVGSLPNLKVLKLLDHACNGRIWETADEQFPQLEYLLIQKSDLVQWTTQSGHFPRLKSLALRSCEQLIWIPLGIGGIPTLNLIEVDRYCSEYLMNSAKQIKRDRESNGNYALQLRSHPNELYEELDEQPSTETSIQKELQALQSGDRFVLNLPFKETFIFGQNTSLDHCTFSLHFIRSLYNIFLYHWEYIGIVGSLPNLQVLKLDHSRYCGKTWKTADEQFPQLEYLLMITQSSHFPRLKSLVIGSDGLRYRRNSDS